VIPASRLNRASICPTMRFKSCGSSKGFKPSPYQEPRRISSHYSTIVLAMDFRSQDVPVGEPGLKVGAFSGPMLGNHHKEAICFSFPKYSFQPLSQKN
jgi:hypothetical protein